MTLSKAYNFIQVNELISSSGTLMHIDLQSLSNEDYHAVINLLPDDNQHATKDEQKTLEALGLNYTYIPVDWDAPTTSDFTEFESAMISNKGKKIHIHCAANFRATAFYGIYACKHLNWSTEQVLAFTTPIWQIEDYPIWSNFVDQLTHQA